MTRMNCLLILMAVCCLTLFAAYQLEPGNNNLIITDFSHHTHLRRIMDVVKEKLSPNWMAPFDFNTHGIDFIPDERQLCDNVTFRSLNVSYVTWQTVIPHNTFIYSAFIDNRGGRKLIKVIVIGPLNITDRLYCHIWYRNSEYTAVVKADLIRSRRRGPLT